MAQMYKMICSGCGKVWWCNRPEPRKDDICGERVGGRWVDGCGKRLPAPQPG